MNVNLATLYYAGCCKYRGSSEIKCPISGTKKVFSLQCCTRWAEQVYYTTKTKYLELVMWCKHENVTSYQKCYQLPRWWSFNVTQSIAIKGIVHPKMKIWCLSVYPKGIQDVSNFVSSVEHKHRFLTQTVAVCQSYNSSQWDSWFWERKKHTQTKPD